MSGRHILDNATAHTRMRWGRCVALLGLVLATVVGPSCTRTERATSAPVPAPTPPPWVEVPLMVDALPRGRLALSAYEAALPSRLVVLRVRAWTWGNDVFGFKPSDITLVLSDGSTANAFDGDRARILLDRLNVGLVDNLGATPDGWAASPGGADLALREEVRYSLLYDGDLTRDEPVYGYVVLDAQQPLSSLDGAVLQVAVIRRSDGHVVRRSHRFGVDVPADERSTQ